MCLQPAAHRPGGDVDGAKNRVRAGCGTHANAHARQHARTAHGRVPHCACMRWQHCAFEAAAGRKLQPPFASTSEKSTRDERFLGGLVGASMVGRERVLQASRKACVLLLLRRKLRTLLQESGDTTFKLKLFDLVNIFFTVLGTGDA